MTLQRDGSHKFYDEHRGWKIICLLNESSFAFWNVYIECLYDPANKQETINIISQTTTISGSLNGAWRTANRMAKEMIDFHMDKPKTADPMTEAIVPDYSECPF